MRDSLPLDHVMVETPHPLEEATRLADMFGLPLAWPLLEGDAYSSAGVNFGSTNIEFIDFRVRFGVPCASRPGLGGIAFRTEDARRAADDVRRLGLATRLGEETPAHMTITVEETSVSPTLFLVQYKFDTRGWRERLAREFRDARGGRFGLRALRHVVLRDARFSLPPSHPFADLVLERGAGPHQVVFEASGEHQGTIAVGGLTSDWEIVLIA